MLLEGSLETKDDLNLSKQELRHSVKKTMEKMILTSLLIKVFILNDMLLHLSLQVYILNIVETGSLLLIPMK